MNVSRTILFAGLGLAVLIAGAVRRVGADPATQSFVYDYNSGKFSALSIADAFPFGINDAGDVVGYSASSNCFLLSAGKVTRLVPAEGSQKCSPRSINNARTIVGWYLDRYSAERNFIVTDGAVRTMAPLEPCFASTVAAVNNGGQIAGTCVRAGALAAQGYVLDVNGAPVYFSVPGANGGTRPVGLDGAGDVYGNAIIGYTSKPFSYRQGEIRTFDVPGCEGDAELTGVSGRGKLVGRCRTAGSSSYSGFIMSSPTDPPKFLSAPNGAALSPSGVNDTGLVIGTIGQ